jgi:hypothetical protein
VSGQVSLNTRFLLWRKQVPRENWVSWLSARTSLGKAFILALILGTQSDDQIADEHLRELARALDVEDEGEHLRFADLPRDSNVLVENVRFLFGCLAHGGKKAFAAHMKVDPTTVSRWLSGAYEPQGPSLRQLVSYFGLPPDTDLRHSPIFLLVEPIATNQRRDWLHARIDALSDEDLRQLYPALRRLLEE